MYPSTKKNNDQYPTMLSPTPFVQHTQKSQICLFKNRFCLLKGCVHYIFAKCFLFHFKSSSRSRENQILEFYIFKFYDVIKCLSIEQE